MRSCAVGCFILLFTTLTLTQTSAAFVLITRLRRATGVERLRRTC